MVNFADILAEKKAIIWKEVQAFLPTEGPLDFVEITREYPARQGKYGRGTLVLLGCEAFGGDPSKAVRTAAAMQISEDWILIHDDFEDDSEERRGKPALHKIYGNELAINAGDALHVLMWKVLLANRPVLGDDLTFRVMGEFQRFLEITTRGQHLENSLTFLDRVPLEQLDYSHYEQIVYGKTCEYTIAGPIRLGAIIAGADDRALEKISQFAIPLGKGFQIRDDILNLVGKGSAYGKEIGGDIFEGKRTIMLIHLIKHTAGDEHARVLEIMKKPRAKKTEKDIEFIIDLMKKRGSIAHAEEMAERYAGEAKAAFNKHFPGLPNRDAFEAAIEFFAKKRMA
nr:polyprenyl synthetase family protein [Candidatus Sigynarchaeum springense]